MSVSADSVMVTAGDRRQLQVLTTTGTNTPTVVLHMGTPAGLAQLPAQLVRDARCRIVTYARPGYGVDARSHGRQFVSEVAAARPSTERQHRITVAPATRQRHNGIIVALWSRRIREGPRPST